MVRDQRAAALMGPGAGHGWQTGHREQLHRAVTLPRKPVAEPDEATLPAAVEARKIEDLVLAEPCNARRPRWVSSLEMCLETFGIVGVARHVVAVGVAFFEQDMHDRAGECTVGTWQRGEVKIGLLGRRGAVGIDNDEHGAAFLPRRCDVGHHVDLRRDRIAAPDHDEVGFGDLAPVDAALRPDPGEPAGIR